jgi:primosomal protein N' (replication factor Y)
MWRAKNEGARIILGSATPSLESMVNVERGKLTRLTLDVRAQSNSVLPSVTIVDLKSRSQHTSHKYSDRAQSEGQRLCILSKPLQNAIAQTLARGEQAMLFLNRRGYASFVLCDACGVIVQCPYCSTSMTYYQQSAMLRCNQCDFSQGLPENCKACHEPSLLALGLGTERVEKEVQLAFPDARIARLDRDVAKGGRAIKGILNEMHEGHIDILIGTQMIAKGHDFARVSLVGVVLADTALAMPDFRASERTFQLLTQVAGRAGRREAPGQVIIQTFNPNHPAITFAKNHDVNGFMTCEGEIRKQAKQPPFIRSVLLRIESNDQKKASHNSTLIYDEIKSAIERLNVSTECHILGPSPAPIEKLREQYRWQIYLRTSTAKIRSDILSLINASKIKLIIDIDPQSMM